MEAFQKLYTEDSNFKGFNVTIPHKVAVMPLLSELSPEAKEIGAVNCITIRENNGIKHLKGYNTDAYGFTESLKPSTSYYGESQCFLFRFGLPTTTSPTTNTSQLTIWKGTGENNFYVFCDTTYISFGASSGSYALYLDEFLDRGCSHQLRWAKEEGEKKLELF